MHYLVEIVNRTQRNEAHIVKFIIMMPKRDDMSRDDFMYRWRDVCVPAAKQLPGLRRYVINPVLPAEGGSELTCQVTAEMWFDDAAAEQAAFVSKPGQEIMADLAEFADVNRLVMSVVEEQVIIA